MPSQASSFQSSFLPLTPFHTAALCTSLCNTRYGGVYIRSWCKYIGECEALFVCKSQDPLAVCFVVNGFSDNQIPG